MKHYCCNQKELLKEYKKAIVLKILLAEIKDLIEVDFRNLEGISAFEVCTMIIKSFITQSISASDQTFMDNSENSFQVRRTFATFY